MLTNEQIDENDLNTKLQKKLLWTIMLTGCIANMVGFLSNAVMFGMSLPTIICGVCEVIAIGCGILGIGFRKQKCATVVMILMFTLLEFPFLFYVYGANMGVYFILEIVALAVYFPRPFHVPAIIITILLDISVMIFSYLCPSTMEEMTKESMIGTLLCSFVIVAIATAVILCILIRQYVWQRNHMIMISQKLEYAAQRDALTGVYNRRYLLETLKQWMSMENSHFLVALIDIDDFKEINDTYGHVYGDEVLIEMASLMKREMAGKGIVTRYGGEEFMFLFENPDYEAALDILARIKKELEDYSMRTRNIVITFSGGMEEFRTAGRVDELFHNADKKLYQAKNNGKNQVIF